MSEIKMNEFGAVLTGRAYGKDCFEKISRMALTPPITVNFKGVLSLGSSFGEEVLVPLSKIKNQKIIIISANPAIRDCIEKIQIDYNLGIIIRD